jgi:hypothetical protein
MAISYSFDREQRRLNARAEGCLGLADVEAYLSAKEEDSVLGYGELFDAGAATTNLTADDVGALVGRFRELITSVRLGPTAVVTTDQVLVGTARMFSALVEPLGMIVKVFHELRPAEQWLDAQTAERSHGNAQPDLSGSPHVWTCPHCGHGEWTKKRQCPRCGRLETEPRAPRPTL